MKEWVTKPTYQKVGSSYLVRYKTLCVKNDVPKPYPKHLFQNAMRARFVRGG